MIDLAALSIAPRDTAKPEAPKGRRGGARKMSPEAREKVAAHARAMGLAAAARRGVTLWQKCAMVMAPGRWYLAREVWSEIPSAKGVTRSRVSQSLATMAKYGHTVRKEIPGYKPEDGKPRRIEADGGRSYIARKPRWMYLITPQGLELAEEGRRRRAEGRPDCLYSGAAKVGRPKGYSPGPWKPDRKVPVRRAGRLSGAKAAPRGGDRVDAFYREPEHPAEQHTEENQVGKHPGEGADFLA